MYYIYSLSPVDTLCSSFPSSCTSSITHQRGTCSKASYFSSTPLFLWKFTVLYPCSVFTILTDIILALAFHGLTPLDSPPFPECLALTCKIDSMLSHKTSSDGEVFDLNVKQFQQLFSGPDASLLFPQGDLCYREVENFLCEMGRGWVEGKSLPLLGCFQNQLLCHSLYKQLLNFLKFGWKKHYHIKRKAGFVLLKSLANYFSPFVRNFEFQKS